MIDAQVWTGIDAEGEYHTSAVFETERGWWEVLGGSSTTYPNARRAVHVDLIERRGLDIRHLYAPGETIPPKREWLGWPNAAGLWWMRLRTGEHTVAVVADKSFIHEVMHVRLTIDITGRYMDQEQLQRGGALFCRVEPAPTPPKGTER